MFQDHEEGGDLQDSGRLSYPRDKWCIDYDSIAVYKPGDLPSVLALCLHGEGNLSDYAWSDVKGCL